MFKVNSGSPRPVHRETFQNLVMQALQLRRIYREAFILCDIKAYSAAEAAAIVGVDEQCIMRRLRLARGLVRRNRGSQAE